jgi:hypothetical protein
MSQTKGDQLLEKLARLDVIRSPDQQAFHDSFLKACEPTNAPPLSQEEFNAAMLQMGATPEMIFQRKPAPTEEDIKRWTTRQNATAP